MALDAFISFTSESQRSTLSRLSTRRERGGGGGGRGASVRVRSKIKGLSFPLTEAPDGVETAGLTFVPYPNGGRRERRELTFTVIRNNVCHVVNEAFGKHRRNAIRLCRTPCGNSSTLQGAFAFSLATMSRLRNEAFT